MTARRSLVFWMLLLVGIFGTVGRLDAQSGLGSILGSVKDSTGAAIPNAVLEVTNTATGVKISATATGTGDYTVLSLIPGSYTVTAQAPGFSKQVVSGITLTVDQQARVNITLKPGGASEIVEVTAGAVELDTDTSAITQLVSSKQVVELPLNGRNFMDLLFIGGGAVQTGSEQGSMRAGKGNGISINGSRPESNNYLLDGMLNTDQALNTPSVVLSVDAIQEFKVLSETYSAQYGFGANQISITSKSGTNSLHGSVFEFNRNDAFDALSYKFPGTTPEKDKLRQNQFGFVANGPVYIPFLYHGRDKTFWMANYEGWRINTGGGSSVTNVPTPDNLAGKFTTPVTDPLTGEPFPGGDGFASIIPADRFSRVAKVSIGAGMFPAPNCTGCTGNYQFPTTTNLKTNQQTYRVDQDFGKFGRIFGRGTYAKYVQGTVSSPSGSVGGNFFTETDANWAASHTISITPHLVNQFTLGKLDAYSVQSGATVSAELIASLGLNGTFPTQTDAQRSFSHIGFANQKGENFGGFGGPVNAYTYSDNPMWQFGDTVSYIHGAHTLSVGADYRKWHLYRDLADDFNGDYTYATYATGDQTGDFLLGTYSGAAGFVPGPFSTPGVAGNLHDYRFSYFAGYLQDDWKVDSKLTLNLGLRWDLRAVPSESKNHMGWLDVTNAKGGMCIADKKLLTDGVAPPGNGFYRYCGRTNPAPNELSDFAPRVGGAYRIDNKTVVRAGFGIFWDGVEGREIDNSGDIYPYVSRTSLTQIIGQDTYKTTDQLFPSFGTAGPITGGPNGPNSFIAVIISEKPKNPVVTQWSASFERELARNTTLEVSYVGNKGNRLLARNNINQAYAPSDPDACNVTPLPDNCTVVARRPFSNFATYLDSKWIGHSNYNGLNLKFEQRTNNLAFTSVYTWAKNLDDKSTAAAAGGSATGWQGFLNNHDPERDYGRSDFAVGQRFVNSFVYKLPIGRGQQFGRTLNRVANLAVGGWQTTGIVTFQQGFPVDASANDNGGLLDSYGYNRADAIGSAKKVKYSIDNRYATQNLNQYSKPAFASYGSAGRNTLTLPGLANFDLGFNKSFEFTEKTNFQLRFESFNTFNHPQFGTLGNSISSNVENKNSNGDLNFGQITSAGKMRILQVSGKFNF